MRHAVGVAAEPYVADQRLLSHGAQQTVPVFFGDDDDGDPAIGSRIDIVGRHRQPGMAVAGSWRQVCRLAAEMHADGGGERGIRRILHRNLHIAALARAFAREQRGHHRAIQVGAAKEVANGRPRLGWRAVREAGCVHDADGGLHRQVHRQPVAVRAGLAITGAAGIDQPRVPLAQRLMSEAQPVHGAGREILDHDIGAIHQPQENLLPLRILEVERQAELV